MRGTDQMLRFSLSLHFPIIPLPNFQLRNVLDKLVQSMPAQVHALTFETNAKWKKNILKSGLRFLDPNVFSDVRQSSLSVFIQPTFNHFFQATSSKILRKLFSLLGNSVYSVCGNVLKWWAWCFKRQTWKSKNVPMMKRCWTEWPHLCYFHPKCNRHHYTWWVTMKNLSHFKTFTQGKVMHLLTEGPVCGEFSGVFFFFFQKRIK